MGKILVIIADDHAVVRGDRAPGEPPLRITKIVGLRVGSFRGDLPHLERARIWDSSNCTPTAQ